MHVRITRRGGIAGIPLSADFDTEALDERQAPRVEHAVTQIVQKHGAARPAPQHPDAFEYEIALPEQGRAARVGESEIPADLRPLLKELVARGTPG